MFRIQLENSTCHLLNIMENILEDVQTPYDTIHFQTPSDTNRRRLMKSKLPKAMVPQSSSKYFLGDYNQLYSHIKLNLIHDDSMVFSAFGKARNCKETHLNSIETG